MAIVIAAKTISRYSTFFNECHKYFTQLSNSGDNIEQTRIKQVLTAKNQKNMFFYSFFAKNGSGKIREVISAVSWAPK